MLFILKESRESDDCDHQFASNCNVSEEMISLNNLRKFKQFQDHQGDAYWALIIIMSAFHNAHLIITTILVIIIIIIVIVVIVNIIVVVVVVIIIRSST